MKQIIIRPYQQEDFKYLEEIHDNARKIELQLANLPDAFLPLSIAAFKENLFDYYVDVALIDNDIVGFSAYNEEEFAWLYVDINHFKEGIGTALINHAINRFDSINEIEVLLGNYPAKNLYESVGFVIDKIVSGVMPGNESFKVNVWRMIKQNENRNKKTSA